MVGCDDPETFYPVWKSTSELGYLREPPRHRADAATGTTSRRWRGIATPSSRRGHGDNIMKMAWNRHAIAQTQLRKHVASIAWAPEI